MNVEPWLTRRAFLRGAGAVLAVPLLESWPWPRAWGAPPPPPGKPPLRLLFVYTPNGVNVAKWLPKVEGELSPTLAPLAPHVKHLTIVSGLACDGARGKTDGAGDHARAAAAFLTCAHPRKTDGADIEAGISVDQVAAKVLGQGVPYPSLELGTEASAQGGSCDSGYSCAYSSNVSWASPGQPMLKEISPRRAFERLFLDGDGLTPEKRARRDRLRASVLDVVREDAKAARGKLGVGDRKKLDEYLDAVREVEKRLAPRKDRDKLAKGPDAKPPPGGIPSDLGAHVRAHFDIVRLAFQTDLTRVATVMIGNEGSNRPFREVGVPDGHHDCSHHGKDDDKKEKVAKIDKYLVEQLAYLSEELKQVKEGSASLLDSSLVVYGSCIADGDAHNHDDLPILLMGSAGGTIATGRHLKARRDTPLANLYLWILQRAGVKTAQFADSREPLAGLGR